MADGGGRGFNKVGWMTWQASPGLPKPCLFVLRRLRGRDESQQPGLGGSLATGLCLVAISIKSDPWRNSLECDCVALMTRESDHMLHLATQASASAPPRLKLHFPPTFLKA